jgi:hypothetical protein
MLDADVDDVRLLRRGLLAKTEMRPEQRVPLLELVAGHDVAYFDVKRSYSTSA